MRDNRNPLFTEIERYRSWAANISPENRVGIWEDNYPHWKALWSSAVDFIENSRYEDWDDNTLEDILYVIARDNQSEYLANVVAMNEGLHLFLTEKAAKSNETEAKWLMAKNLPRCSDKQVVEEFLFGFVVDEDEYVNRTALIALAEIQSTKTEYYCELAWNRDCYGDLQEYQRIAALSCLHKVGSFKLQEYLELAKQDGRKYLLQKVQYIEAEL